MTYNDLQNRATVFFSPTTVPHLFIYFFICFSFLFLSLIFLALDLYSSIFPTLFPHVKRVPCVHIDVCMFINSTAVGRSAMGRERLPKQITLLSVIWPSQSHADLISDINKMLRESERDGGRNE